MDTQLLERIGLTRNEANVYLALLELGSSTTGPIVEKSGAASSKIYEILDRLIEKGLVSYVLKGKMKHFEAGPPERILDYVDEKQKAIEKEKKEAEKAIPQLALLRTRSKFRQEASIYRGMKGLRTAFYDGLASMERGECFDVMGMPARSKSVNLFFLRFNRDRAARGVKMRILFDETAIDDLQAKKENSPLSEIKFMPKGIVTPAAVNIYKDRVLIFPAETEEQPLVIVIQNKEVVDSFRTQFELLWNQETRVYKGLEGFKAVFNDVLDTLKKGDEFLAYSIPPESEKMLDFLDGFIGKGVKKGMKFRLMYDERAKESKLAKKHGYPMKTIPKEYATPAEIDIYGDKTAIMLWSKNPMAFVIQNKEITDTFRTHFEMLWGQKTKVYNGLEGIKSLFNEMLDYKEHWWIGGTWDVKKLMPGFWEEWNEKRVGKKILWRDLIDHGVEKYSMEEKGYYEYKVLPEELKSPHVIAIFGDKICNLLWNGEKSTAFVIEDGKIADSYRKYFEFLWGQEARVFHDLEGIRAIHEKSYKDLERGDEYVYMGVPEYQPEEHHEYWMKDHERRVRAGIKTRILYNWGTSPKILENRNGYWGCDARYMPEGIKTPAYFAVFKERVMIAIPSKEPVAIEITNKEIADSFMAYFEALWRLSEPFGKKKNA